MPSKPLTVEEVDEVERENRAAGAILTDCGIDPATDFIARLLADWRRMRSAIRWALGEEGNFGEAPEDLLVRYRGRYWWRHELRERAALAPKE